MPDDPPAKRAKKTQEVAPSAQDVRMASGEAKAEKESSTESNSDSSASNSDFSSEDGSSDVSDLDKFEEAYKELGGLTAGVDDVDFDRIVAGNTNDDVPGLVLEGGLETLQTLANVFFFFLVSRTRHHSCAGHCFTIRSHCNFFRNATIPPGRNKKQRKTKQTATKQNQQRNTNQTQTENQTPEWKLSSLFLYNIQLK